MTWKSCWYIDPSGSWLIKKVTWWTLLFLYAANASLGLDFNHSLAVIFVLKVQAMWRVVILYCEIHYGNIYNGFAAHQITFFHWFFMITFFWRTVDSILNLVGCVAKSVLTWWGHARISLYLSLMFAYVLLPSSTWKMNRSFLLLTFPLYISWIYVVVTFYC